MREIQQILYVEEKVNKRTHKPYHKTTALLDDGTEAKGFGNDYRVGDMVMTFYEDKWDEIKMIRPLDRNISNVL